MTVLWGSTASFGTNVLFFSAMELDDVALVRVACSVMFSFFQ